jgi:hypothetical protein
MNILQTFGSPRGFINRYMQNLNDSATQIEAYERTEAEYKIIFGRQKYSNYESFRRVKNRMMKSN